MATITMHKTNPINPLESLKTNGRESMVCYLPFSDQNRSYLLQMVVTHFVFFSSVLAGGKIEMKGKKKHQHNHPLIFDG